MSPLRDVVATTGMGGGPLAATFAAASADFLAAIFAHRKYPPKPNTRRTNSHSHRRRRRAGLVFPGGARPAGAVTSNAGADETTIGSLLSGDCSVGTGGVSSIMSRPLGGKSTSRTTCPWAQCQPNTTGFVAAPTLPVTRFTLPDIRRERRCLSAG